MAVFPSKEEELGPDDFNKMLKLNSPKYILFKTNHSEKMIGEGSRIKKNPLAQVYHSKDLVNMLKAKSQQRRFL